MTDAGQVESTPAQVRNLLDCVLRQALFPGRDELLRQVESVTIGEGSITMLDLRVADETPKSRCPDGPAPLRAIVTETDGTTIGELLIWVKGGHLNSLEFAWWTEDPPERLPLCEQVRVVNK